MAEARVRNGLLFTERVAAYRLDLHKVLLRSPAVYLGGWLMLFGVAAYGAAASDPAKTVGPNACAECHKQEAEAWKGTHHFKTFRDMPRNTGANEIAKKMGVRRIKSESLCLNCHFTMQQKEGTEEPVAGISCESCHSAGLDWIKKQIPRLRPKRTRGGNSPIQKA
jgi:Cytochrome c554 and c-prime